MRSCDEIVELISAALDGELSADEQTALDEHIACCPACSALLDDLRALHTAAADWEDVPAPVGFTEAVMRAIAAETIQEKPDNVIPFAAPKKAKRTYRKTWGVTAAAVAIVALGAVTAPSLLGNFNAAKSESLADMVCAQSETDVIAEAAMNQEQTYSFEVQDAVDAKYGEVLIESAPGEDTKTTTNPYYPLTDTPSPSSMPEEYPYVGELVLDGMLEILSEQEGAASSDGTVTYLVSADVFSEVLKVLETEEPVVYVYTAGNTEAQLGKIIVQSN